MSPVEKKSANVRAQLEELYRTSSTRAAAEYNQDCLDPDSALYLHCLRERRLSSRRQELAQTLFLGAGLSVAVLGLILGGSEVLGHVPGLPKADVMPGQPTAPLYAAPSTPAAQPEQSFVPIPGMVADKSAITGIVDPQSLSAVYYWTLSLQNHTSLQQEAQMEIQLPRGATVSRATLWINGVPQEAAFSSTEQVTHAYEWITQRHRDPLLVTQTAPGRITIKASPVQPGGVPMKLRIGITAPMAVDANGDARVLLPSVVSSNTAVACRQDVHLESTAALHSPTGRVHLSSQMGRSVLRANIRPEDLMNMVVTAERPDTVYEFATRATHSRGFIVAQLRRDFQSGLMMPVLHKVAARPDCTIIQDENAAHRVSSLWAFGEIEDLASQGNIAQANDLANAYRIVSSVSGATVLEMASDYTYNSLNRDMNRTVDYQPAVSGRAPETSASGTQTAHFAAEQAPMLQGATNGTIGPQGADAVAPMLQGAINSTIGPQGQDAAVITGVNTAGTVRVNNLANLEALLNVLSNTGELGFLIAGVVLALYAVVCGSVSASVNGRKLEFTRSRCVTVGVVLTGAGLLLPQAINWCVAFVRDCNILS